MKALRTRSQESLEAEVLDHIRELEALSESSVFMFALTETVGRNLFCLDQCDIVSSSRWGKHSQELDREWNI